MAVNPNQFRESVEFQPALSRAALVKDCLLIADYQGWEAKKMLAIGTAGGSSR
jgi:hypothetical protein